MASILSRPQCVIKCQHGSWPKHFEIQEVMKISAEMVIWIAHLVDLQASQGGLSTNDTID